MTTEKVTTSDLTIIDKEINSESQFLAVINEDYPLAVKEGINNVIDIIKDEKQVTDLYPQILAETPISTSQFQDRCVQYEQHFTPHKKLRQSMLELQDKLGALYTAKTGNKRAILKCERTKLEVENLQDELDKAIESKDIYTQKRMQLSLMEKMVDLEEDERSLNSSNHLIKDAMLKIIQHQKLVEGYKKEVENSDLSFEESEVEYYVMYFTNDVEKQLRTGGRIDTGTFGAISNLPDAIRLKVLSNISFMKNKLFNENYPSEGDYLCKVFFEELRPKKTGDGEMEGMNVADFIGTETIKLLAKPK